MQRLFSIKCTYLYECVMQLYASINTICHFNYDRNWHLLCVTLGILILIRNEKKKSGNKFIMLTFPD